MCAGESSDIQLGWRVMVCVIYFSVMQVSGNCPWKYVVYFSSTINLSECENRSTDEISEQN